MVKKRITRRELNTIWPKRRRFSASLPANGNAKRAAPAPGRPSWRRSKKYSTANSHVENDFRLAARIFQHVARASGTSGDDSPVGRPGTEHGGIHQTIGAGTAPRTSTRCRRT